MSICFAISDAEWDITRDVLTIVISLLGVGLAGFVGVSGLKIWRKQVRGTAEHDLALRMLKELYQFHMVLDAGRIARVYESEVKQQDASLSISREEYYRCLELGFERRIEKITSIYAELSASALSAKAVWNEGAQDLLCDIRELKLEYEEYVRQKLLSVNPFLSCEQRDNSKDKLAPGRDVLRESNTISDEFGQTLEAAVQEVEKYLRSKLIT